MQVVAPQSTTHHIFHDMQVPVPNMKDGVTFEGTFQPSPEDISILAGKKKERKKENRSNCLSSILILE